MTLRSPPLAERWMDIRLAVFDVDGILTDGRLALAATAANMSLATAANIATSADLAGAWSGAPAAGGAIETKIFHVLDGHGIKQIARAGIEVAWISGRNSPVVMARARELGIFRLHQAASDKLPVLETLLAELGIGFDAVLCIGDDLADLPLMRRCAIAFTVPHAPAAVKLAADAVTRHAGGTGAVREMCDRLLHGIGRHDLLDEPG